MRTKYFCSYHDNEFAADCRLQSAFSDWLECNHCQLASTSSGTLGRWPLRFCCSTSFAQFAERVDQRVLPQAVTDSRSSSALYTRFTLPLTNSTPWYVVLGVRQDGP
jgi:hypothetical protein